MVETSGLKTHVKRINPDFDQSSGYQQLSKEKAGYIQEIDRRR